MKVIAGVDGSKYGRWATEWIAHVSFASPPQVTGLHVVTTACLLPLTRFDAHYDTTIREGL